ncbi:unnamed protein product [Spirodela intermedia]|uniref:Uncharacterized protein n=1 Tax=Spirodela intermedia TaxID=51605 RepID=A0A7I8KGA2_SPIIN|nr:unnamed protein product [Spirodela intermedia]
METPGGERHSTSRPRTGGWPAAIIIIGVEVAERFAYYGVMSNLITYLTGPLGESTATAAADVNTWLGASAMIPFLGAFVADSYLGRYRTVLLASILYFLGLLMLTLSASLPSLRPPDCTALEGDAGLCPPPSQSQVFFFFASLYMVAVAHGGYKPCIQAFGADQFDGRDPYESKSKSSFFNWWYFGICMGILTALLILNYIQDNLGWVLGFGLPFISMGFALGLLLLGSRIYRHQAPDEKCLSVRIARVVLELLRNRLLCIFSAAAAASGGARESLLPRNTQFKLSDDKAAVIIVDPHLSSPPLQVQAADAASAMEEANGMLLLLPIWAACLVYAVVFAQPPTFFTKQGSTLERHIGGDFQIPPAALQGFISVTIVLFLPVYDRVLVPAVRRITGNPSGITMLQRIGLGMLLSVVSMAVAALVEMKRLRTARELGLVDLPAVALPMSLWWLVPQYVIFGVSEALTMVGLQEFFYDQVPDGLRSLGLALYMSIFGIGSLLSGFLISTIDRVSLGKGESWFSDNLNRAHLDYFYWLLAGLSVAGLVVYLHFARSYLYKKKT